MPTTFAALRRRVLTPSFTDVGFAARGFPAAPAEVTRWLETIPQSVVCGFEWGIETRHLWELERRLDMVEPLLRGFAHEGATMALTVRDAMRGGRGHRARELLLGPGRPHIFLNYIGIGFAMARLPRALWRTVLPDLTGTPYHPTMSWLAVDGYGFDRAYFDTRRWVERQRVPAPYPWQGRPDYFPRAVDQGIGRALWFVHAGQPAAVATAVHRFAEHRRADLWSGVGLAATFAGGCPREGLVELRRAAGEHRAEVALGVVFAAKARDHSGFVPPHTEIATAALADLPVQAAVALADSTEPESTEPESAEPESTEPESTEPGGMTPPSTDAGGQRQPPAYEQWRHRIRSHFVSAMSTN